MDKICPLAPLSKTPQRMGFDIIRLMKLTVLCRSVAIVIAICAVVQLLADSV